MYEKTLWQLTSLTVYKPASVCQSQKTKMKNIIKETYEG